MVGIIAPGHISDAALALMHRRARYGTYDGLMINGRLPDYVRRCTHYCANTDARMIYTRDVGMHTCGWWKNPDYERCLHLSISFEGHEAGRVYPLPQNHRVARRWATALFGDDVRRCWIEPPFSDAGKVRDVWHYRVFCAPDWSAFTPRGEVYSRDWTPADWLSWSDLYGADNGDGAFGADMAITGG